MVDNLVKAQKDFTAVRKPWKRLNVTTLFGCLSIPSGKSAERTVRLKSLGSTAAPCAPGCENSAFENHKFSSQFQSALITCHP